MTDDRIIAAHEHCSRHRDEILASECCGCFYCRTIFLPSEIDDWVDEDPDGDGGWGQGTTALCPSCGIDSVIGSLSGYPITVEFLEQMNEHWF